MKLKYTYGVLCLVLAVVLFLSKFNIKDFDEQNKLEQKSQPSDFFFHQRAYPDEAINLKAYNNGLKEVRQRKEDQKKSTGSLVDWEYIGPGNIGGRINAVIVHPTDTNIIYAGCAAGGIFKTTDAGLNWQPLFDDFSYLAIGDLTFNPLNPNTVFAGTGDPNISGYPFVGDGIYKSSNGGETWQHLGLSEVGIVSRMYISPTDTNLIYVAAMGIPFEQNPHRGLYRSSDGGQSWQQVLFVDTDAGIIDLVVNPENDQTVYAASWNRIRNNSISTIWGNDAKIWKSTNGGNTWSVLGGGLPTGYNGRIGLTISELDTNLLYAVYANTASDIGGLYKTMDAGNSWTSIPVGSPLSWAYSGFGWYFGQIRINPYDNDELFVLGVDLYRSNNAGTNWSAVGPNWATNQFYADKHDLVYFDAQTIYCTTDGGLYKSMDGGNSWRDIDNIPNTQFYRVTCDPHNPGSYAGGAQDQGTLYGSANGFYTWERMLGGDGFQPLFDYNTPGIKYAEMQNGALRYLTPQMTYWYPFTNGLSGAERRSWDMPFIMSQQDPTRLYVGTYRVHKHNHAPYGTWSPISPDLTDGINSKFHVISCLSESDLDTMIFYAGTSDGNVSRTLDGGQTWDAIYQILPDRYVTSVKASPNFQNAVFVSHSGYRDNDYIPYIHYSNDYGATWTDITGDLPQMAVNDLIVLEGFADQVIVAATDGGVYFTDNQGVKWARLAYDMPIVPVYDIDYDPFYQRVIAGTYARSMISISLDSIMTIVSVEEHIKPSTTKELKAYPNPARDFIKISDIPEDTRELLLISTDGRIVKHIPIEDQKSTIVIDVQDLKAGIYSIVARSEVERRSTKVSVLRK